MTLIDQILSDLIGYFLITFFVLWGLFVMIMSFFGFWGNDNHFEDHTKPIEKWKRNDQ